MTILDVVRIARSNLKLLLVSVLVGLLLAAGYTLTRPVQYEATSSAQVDAGASDSAASAQLSDQLASTRAVYYAQVAASPGVADRIIKASNGSLSAGDFSLAGTNAAGTSIINLTATSTSPGKAQQAANLTPNALNAEVKYRETLGRANGSTIYHVFPLTQAGRPSVPSSPKWPVNLAIGAIFGLVAGLAVVVLRKQLDSRVRHTNEVEKITGAGVLGVIPQAKNLQDRHRGGLGSLGTTSEAFRMLRTNLRYVSAEKPPRSLVITSAVQSEGKSTVAANLARVLAAAGQKVILVDTDLRRPVVHDTFEVDNTVGLTEVLTGQATLKDVVQQGDHKNLSVITAGRIPPNPSELLGSRRMGAVIEALEEEYFVVLDAPPLLPVTDGGLLAVAADGAAVVYHYGRTHREQVALCTKILDQVGARYFGSILNMTPQKQMGAAIYGYGAGNYGATGMGYGYGYGYGHTDESQEASALTPAHEVRDLSLHDVAAKAPAADDAATAPVATATASPAATTMKPTKASSSAAAPQPTSDHGVGREWNSNATSSQGSSPATGFARPSTEQAATEQSSDANATKGAGPSAPPSRRSMRRSRHSRVMCARVMGGRRARAAARRVRAGRVRSSPR